MQQQPPPPHAMGAADSDPNRLVASEEEMLRLAPQPHERVVYWGSGSPQGTSAPAINHHLPSH